MKKLNKFAISSRKIRLERGISLRDMARDLGVSIQYLSSKETGKSPLNMRVINKYLDYFDLKGCKRESFILDGLLSFKTYKFDMGKTTDKGRLLLVMLKRRMEGNKYLSDRKIEDMISIMESS